MNMAFPLIIRVIRDIRDIRGSLLFPFNQHLDLQEVTQVKVPSIEPVRSSCFPGPSEVTTDFTDVTDGSKPSTPTPRLRASAGEKVH